MANSSPRRNLPESSALVAGVVAAPGAAIAVGDTPAQDRTAAGDRALSTRRVLLLSAVCSLLSALCVGQEADTGWRGTTWGMSYADLEAHFPGEITNGLSRLVPAGPGLVAYHSWIPFEHFGAEFDRVSFYFSTEDGGLRMIELGMGVHSKHNRRRFKKDKKYKADVLDLLFEPVRICQKIDDQLRSSYGEPTLTRDDDQSDSSGEFNKANEWLLPTTKIQISTGIGSRLGLFRSRSPGSGGCQLSYREPTEEWGSLHSMSLYRKMLDLIEMRRAEAARLNADVQP